MITIDLNGPDTNEASFITFPTGERHLRVGPSVSRDRVMLVYKDTCPDVMRIALAVDALRESGVQTIKLYMPFVPYARQDRRVMAGEPLSIKVFATLLNSLKLDEVIIVDPHSDVTPALIDNVSVIPQEVVAMQAVRNVVHLSNWSGVTGHDATVAIVAPDLGAAKKIKKLQELLAQFGYPVDVIQGDKRRDPKSGKITGFRVVDGDPSLYEHLLMVDDICDGGGTFIGLAEELRKTACPPISLYTTHGIYSKGLDPLRPVFYNVISSDSLGTVPNDARKYTVPVENCFIYG